MWIFFFNKINTFVGHSRTIVGIEQRASGLTLLILDPSHGPRQVAALGSSQDSLRLIRRGPAAMRAPQYQLVAVRGLIDTEEQYQVSVTACLIQFSVVRYIIRSVVLKYPLRKVYI